MKHASKAKVFINNEERVDWHDAALWHVREKRDNSKESLSEWEDLRELASKIKDHTLSRLDEYLQEFETKALENGVKVLWAQDALEHNQHVLNILNQHGIRKVAKSKSMLTEECHLNAFLNEAGIEVTDTDLGERIIQLRQEPPSHIVLPAIHLKKEDVGELFHENLNTPAGLSDPTLLTRAARLHLRNEFIESRAAITGVNFAVAETGSIVVCTNEGNADMGTHLADVQIHCMGIEKVIPRQQDLGVFTRLLARSATGQPITIYTSHHQKPRHGSHMYVILVDNGRSEHLGRKDFKNGLKCIRCGACLNTCPIYRRSGGHSYGTTIPGPIGSILTPGFDLKANSDLPFASTLCGSCTDVCPVKIDIHEQLYKWRQVVHEKGLLPRDKAVSMRLAGRVLSSNTLYNTFGKIARFALKHFPRFAIYNRLNTWGKQRELPEPPKNSFKEWYKNKRS